MRRPHHKVTWHLNPVVTLQFKNLIFPQPRDLCQMALLLRGQVTKMLYLHFHVDYGPWHWLRMREHHLKIHTSCGTSTTWETEDNMPNCFSTKKFKLVFYFTCLYLISQPDYKPMLYIYITSLKSPFEPLLKNINPWPCF